jgi:phosphoribosylglycinamide formyltransferase 1
MINIAVLGSTKGTSIQYTFDQINQGGLNAAVKIVIANKPDAYILQRATVNGFDSLLIPSKGMIRSEYDKLLLVELSKYKIDLVVLVGYMKILSAEFVQQFAGRIINVHPSLLPKFAGGIDGDVHQAVIDAGEKESGCTVHLVDEGVDTGKILLQKSCILNTSETPESLKIKVQNLEGIALFEVIRDWQSVRFYFSEQKLSPAN